MRKPTKLTPWLTAEQLRTWVKSAPDKAAHERRLAVWLTQEGSFNASRVANLLAVSTQAVWKWISEYNKFGPTGLERTGRGGRRWSLMSLDEERAFLSRNLINLETGALLTPMQVHAALIRVLGREVSVDYIYKLLHRHPLRKLPKQLPPSPR
jgi:transposase